MRSCVRTTILVSADLQCVAYDPPSALDCFSTMRTKECPPTLEMPTLATLVLFRVSQRSRRRRTTWQARLSRRMLRQQIMAIVIDAGHVVSVIPSRVSLAFGVIGHMTPRTTLLLSRLRPLFKAFYHTSSATFDTLVPFGLMGWATWCNILLLIPLL